MKNWVYHSRLNGVFKSRGAGWIPYKTGVRKILETIKNYKNKIFPTNEIFDVYTNHPVTFSLDYTEERMNNLDRIFLFYLVYTKSQVIEIKT